MARAAATASIRQRRLCVRATLMVDFSDHAQPDHKLAYEAQLAALTNEMNSTADYDAYIKAEAEIEALKAEWASGAFAAASNMKTELTKATTEVDAVALEAAIAKAVLAGVERKEPELDGRSLEAGAKGKEDRRARVAHL